MFTVKVWNERNDDEKVGMAEGIRYKDCYPADR